MKPTNYFRSRDFAVKALKQDQNIVDCELEADRLIANGTYKIGYPPVTKYADYNGRYYIVGSAKSE